MVRYSRKVWSGIQLVGRYQDAAGVEHSFVGPIAGPFSTFDVPDAAGTYATHSNSAGQIAGFWADSASAYHGFLRNTDGGITRFDVPG
jgi:hypothetical protein